MPKKLTHKEFLEKLLEKNEHYRSGGFEVVGKYNGLDKHIIVKDVFGECSILANDLMVRNAKTRINTAVNKTDYFSNEVVSLNKFYRNGDFRIIRDYKGRRNHIKVLYKDLEYSITAINLLQDYLPSVQTATNKSLFWIEKFKIERTDFDNIDYSIVKYKTSRDNLDFKCKIHNIKYSQRLDHHLNNVQGCMKYPIIYNTDTVLKHKDFLEKINGFLYVIKLQSFEEHFYKVGITGENRMKYRFLELEKNYKISFEYLQKGLMTNLFNLEQRFLKEFENFKYIPKIKFRGHTECLTTNPIAEYYNININNNESNN